MSRKVIYIKLCASILICIVVNMLAYNWRIMVEHLLQIEPPYLAHYIIRFALYFFATFFFARDKRISHKTVFWLIFTPLLILDATTVFTGPELIPLRFPYDTIYPLLGILLSLKMAEKNYWVYIIISGLFFVSGEVYVRDYLIWKQRKFIAIRDIPDPKIFSGKFLTNENKLILLRDTVKQKLQIVETYFVGCKPCEEKFNILKQLKKKYQKLEVILICNGEITNFKDFLNHEKKNRYDGITFLYDNKKVLNGMQWITGYPTELLFFDKQLKNVDVGFSEIISKRWFTQEVQLIDKLYEKHK